VEEGRRPGDSVWAQISDELASTRPDVHALLTTLTQILSRVGAGTWIALVMNPDPTTSRLVVADDAEHAMAAYVEKLIAAASQGGGTPTFGLAQSVIESGHPVFIERITLGELIAGLSPAAEDYHAANPPPIGMDAARLLIVPMRAGGAIIGTLGIFAWHRESRLGEADLPWLQAIADRAGLALDHARLYSAERTQVERLGVISGIVLTAGYVQDLRLTLRVIVEQVTTRLAADAADILLVNAQEKALAVAARAGFRTSSVEHYHLPIDSELSDLAHSRVRIEHVTDTEAARRNPRRSLFGIEGFQTYVQIPLRARGDFVGVLEMFNRSPVEWDQQSLDFLETLAGIAAVVIDYAILTAPRGSVAPRAFARSPRSDLNDLELSIVRLIVEGLTNREISARVHRSENTIKAQVRRILEKTEAVNRTDLAHRAALEGWLEPRA